MKSNSRVLLTQFRSKLKKIVSSHPSQSVRISEFMNILTIHYIRIYSKADIGKLYRYFDNPLKISRIAIPLSYLQLDCVQQCDSKKYFVAKVSDIQVHMDLSQQKQVKHNVLRCLEAFIKIMKRLYGSEKNWFKVLGGLTVAITIQPNNFKRSVSKILCNTSHTGCAQSIMNVFLNQSSSHNIQWKAFMKVIYQYELLKAPIAETKFSWTNSASVTAVQICSHFLQTGNNTKRNTSFKEPNERVQSAHSRPSIKMKRSSKSTTSPAHLEQSEPRRKQCIQFPRFFSLSAKPCVLYTKKDEHNKTFTTSFRPKTEQRRSLRHRKTKTQPIFFEKLNKEVERCEKSVRIKQQVQKIEIPKNFLQAKGENQEKRTERIQLDEKNIQFVQTTVTFEVEDPK